MKLVNAMRQRLHENVAFIEKSYCLYQQYIIGSSAEFSNDTADLSNVEKLRPQNDFRYLVFFRQFSKKRSLAKVPE